MHSSLNEFFDSKERGGSSHRKAANPPSQKRGQGSPPRNESVPNASEPDGSVPNDSNPHGYARTLDTLLVVSTCADHSFNADYLHQFLISEKMPDRDTRWSIFLFQEYGNGRSVDRLIEWALSEKGHAHFDNE